MLVPVPHSSIRSDLPPPSFSGCNAYHRNLDLHSQCQGNHTPTFAAQLKKNVYPRYKHSSTVSVHIMLYRTQHSSPSLPSLPFPSLHTDAGRESLHVMFNFLSHNLLMIQGKENNQTAQSSITSGVQSKSKKKRTRTEQNSRRLCGLVLCHNIARSVSSMYRSENKNYEKEEGKN